MVAAAASFGSSGTALVLAENSGSVDSASAPGSATAIAAGLGQSCALTRTGGVKCWGSNGHDELGDGRMRDSLAPVDVSGLSRGVTAIAAGVRHTCALTSAGGVKCWGINSNGTLGDGTASRRFTPVDVSGPERRRDRDRRRPRPQLRAYEHRWRQVLGLQPLRRAGRRNDQRPLDTGRRLRPQQRRDRDRRRRLPELCAHECRRRQVLGRNNRRPLDARRCPRPERRRQGDRRRLRPRLRAHERRRRQMLGQQRRRPAGRRNDHQPLDAGGRLRPDQRRDRDRRRQLPAAARSRAPAASSAGA